MPRASASAYSASPCCVGGAVRYGREAFWKAVLARGDTVGEKHPESQATQMQPTTLHYLTWCRHAQPRHAVSVSLSGPFVSLTLNAPPPHPTLPTKVLRTFSRVTAFANPQPQCPAHPLYPRAHLSEGQGSVRTAFANPNPACPACPPLTPCTPLGGSRGSVRTANPRCLSRTRASKKAWQ